jgi:hypothetical protein
VLFLMCVAFQPVPASVLGRYVVTSLPCFSTLAV